LCFWPFPPRLFGWNHWCFLFTMPILFPFSFVNLVMSILSHCLCGMVYLHDCPQPFPHCCPGACDSDLPASLLGSEAFYSAHALAQTDPVEAVKMMASGSKECTYAEWY
jgi:hypothetical protein